MDSVTALLREIRVQRFASIAEFLSTVVVAALVLALWLRFTRIQRPWQRAAWGLSGCATITVYGAVAFVAAVCWGGGVYTSAKSNLARTYAAPVVAALSRYQTANGRYPTVLQQLVPSYISAAALHAVEASPLKYPLEYVRQGSSYTLRVRYGGPGMNQCEVSPGHDWECSGLW